VVVNVGNARAGSHHPSLSMRSQDQSMD
jgi:hypothetical protein